MRIMATSDLHGNLEGLDPSGADVVVLAGDIAPRTRRRAGSGFMRVNLFNMRRFFLAFPKKVHTV